MIYFGTSIFFNNQIINYSSVLRNNFTGQKLKLKTGIEDQSRYLPLDKA